MTLKEKQLNDLLELCGHWRDGSCETLKMGWDDATHMFFISVGRRHYSGSNFDIALERTLLNNPNINILPLSSD